MLLVEAIASTCQGSHVVYLLCDARESEKKKKASYLAQQSITAPVCGLLDMRAAVYGSRSIASARGHFSRARSTLAGQASKRGQPYSSSSSTGPTQEPVIFSGIQPTGVPHLGNYLGALRQWVKLQDDAQPGTKLLFSIVDLHALTVPQDASQLKRWRAEAFATLLAVGLDPKRSTIFYQSAVGNIRPLIWWDEANQCDWDF